MGVMVKTQGENSLDLLKKLIEDFWEFGLFFGGEVREDEGVERDFCF